MNLCLFGGNLTRKPEIRQVGPNNTSVANFTIAVNKQYTDSAGNKKKEATFIDCEIWDSGADTMVKYCDKGDYIIVYTTAKNETWKDKNDGSNRSRMKFRVDRFEFAGGAKKKSVEDNEDAPSEPAGASTNSPEVSASGDPIPF